MRRGKFDREIFMHRRTLISVAVIAAAGLSVNVARADAPSAAAEVTVGLSTALQAKREEIGQRGSRPSL